MDWKDHIPEDQRGDLLAQYDDGSAVFLAGYAGGGSEEGLWGSLELMRVSADGKTEFRPYSASGDWSESGVKLG